MENRGGKGKGKKVVGKRKGYSEGRLDFLPHHIISSWRGRKSSREEGRKEGFRDGLI